MRAAVLTKAGFDPQALLGLSREPLVRDALTVATEAAVQRGVFGAPTFLWPTRCSGARTDWTLCAKHWPINLRKQHD
ncbi:DsbA family protein [Rhodoferax sp. UBA5149]|uniref:DsbA family protein n=1 Tax=Rhodoferax sp. UBA5149 TaxID=1947379 RepID=UPI0026012543|nr:DsbA family protein [Rhodoferax sp. UBA5149]